MKKTKKLISLCIAVSTAMTGLCFPVKAADAWEARTNDVDLRVGLIADTHVSANSDGKAFRNVVEALRTIGGEQLDAIAMNGDIVLQKSTNASAHYDTVYSILNQNGIGQQAEGLESNIPVIYAMGNHEFPQDNNDATTCAESVAIFKEKTGQDLDYHAEYNGYHFIASGGASYNCQWSAGNYNTNEEWIMTEIDKALADDPSGTKPVFLMLHHPINNTACNYSDKRYTTAFVEFLKARPRVINLTAHVHSAAQNPLTMWQGGFTSYQLPAGDGSGKKQASFIEIEDSVVKIYKVDIATKEYIGEPWVIDTSKGAEGFAYTAAARTNLNAPTYSEDAKLEVSDITKYTATLTYPLGSCEQTGVQQDGFVASHRIVLTNKNSGVVVNEQTKTTPYYTTFTDYSAIDETAEHTLEYPSLSAGATYTVSVYPRSPFGTEGEPLTTEFTTEGQALKITTGEPIALTYDETLMGDTTTLDNDGYTHDTVKDYFTNLSDSAISLRGVATDTEIDNYFTYKINVGEGYKITEPGYYQLSVRYVATNTYGILLSVNDVPMIKATLEEQSTGPTLGKSESKTIEDLGYIWLDAGENILKYELTTTSGGSSCSLFTDLPVLRKIDKTIMDRVINNSYTIVDATETDASYQTKTYAGFRQGDYVMLPVKVPYTSAYRIEMSASSAQNYGFSAVYGEDQTIVEASEDYTITGEVQAATGSEKANFEKSSLTDSIILEADKQYYFKICATTVENGGIMTLEKIRVIDNGDWDASANLTALSVDGYHLDSDFDEDDLSYVIYTSSVPTGNQVTVTAESFSPNATVGNVGVVEVTDTVTDIPVTVTSADGENTRVYNIRFVVDEPISLGKTASIYYKDSEGVENTGDVSGVLTAAGVSHGSVIIPWNNYTTEGYIKIDLEDKYNLAGFTWMKGASGQHVNVEVYGSVDESFENAVLLGKTTKDSYFDLGLEKYLDSCSLDSTTAYQYVWVKIDESKDFCPIQISLYALPEIDEDSTEIKSLAVEGYSFDSEFNVNDTEYIIMTDELPASGTINVKANAFISDITISGAGETAVKCGINELPVTVTSANGENTTTYTIKFIVTKTVNASLNKTALYNNQNNVQSDVSKILTSAGVSRGEVQLNVTSDGKRKYAYTRIDLENEYHLKKLTWTKTNYGKIPALNIYGANKEDGTDMVLIAKTESIADTSVKVINYELDWANKYRFVFIKPTQNGNMAPLTLSVYAFAEPELTTAEDGLTTTVTVPSSYYAIGDTVIAASYNGGKLSDVELKNPKNGEYSAEAILTKETAEDTVKFMVWKDLKNLVPRMEEVSFE